MNGRIIELKPCPWCGEMPEIVKLFDAEKEQILAWKVECANLRCQRRMVVWSCLSVDDAMKGWRRMCQNITNKLKPCPFCGGEGVHLDKAYSYFRDIVIYCEGCDMVFTLDDCSTTEEDIANAWNRRTIIDTSYY